MTRGTAMLLAPHATRLNALMAAGPARAVVIAAVCILVVLLASAVVTYRQRRTP